MAGKRKIPRGRLLEVERRILAGQDDHRIQSDLSVAYAISRSQVRRYIGRVNAKLAALPSPDPEATRRKVEAMFAETYALARDGKKFIVVSQGKGEPSAIEERPEANVGVMATIAHRLATLRGAELPRKIELSGEVKSGAPTAEALHERLQGLAARATEGAGGADPGAAPPADPSPAG